VGPSRALMWNCLDVGFALVYHVNVERLPEPDYG
jgi:hypothetical protein